MSSNFTSDKYHLLPEDWISCKLDDLACLAPVQEVSLPQFEESGLRLSIKREDLLHPKLGGNKLYKLHAHIHEALKEIPLGQLRLASFGGAWSNHIYALAAAGEQLGVPTLGVIRGDDGTPPTAMLQDARAMGMKIHHVSRENYRRRGERSWHQQLEGKLGSHYWIPEGGGGYVGACGASSLMRGVLSQVQGKVDLVAHAVGTGTSLAGLISAAPVETQVNGVAVLKLPGVLEKDINAHLKCFADKRSGWTIWHEFHCGGYARLSGKLSQFINDFEKITNIGLDPVYTAKLMYGLNDLARRRTWPAGTHIVAIHSGGLQGRRGLPQLDKDARLQ